MCRCSENAYDDQVYKYIHSVIKLSANQFSQHKSRALNNHKVVYEKRAEEQKIFADPYSEESQKRIAEQIRQVVLY